MNLKLGLHLGYASTRFYEPKIWTEMVRNEFDLNYVQFTSNLLEPTLPNQIISDEIDKIKFFSKKYNIKIDHTFTSPRNNFFGHSNKKIRMYWSKWLMKFLWISKKLGAEGAGSLLGIMSFNDVNKNFKQREKDIIDGWKKLSIYGKKIGLKYLLWEPMSIRRELGDTIKYTKYLHKKLNINSKIPILLNLDVDHGNHFSKDKRDGNPYEWLNGLSNLSPSIHIKQKTKDIYTHKPFIKKYNKSGIIKPDKILKSLEKSNCKDTTLYFEFSFREREPFDSQSIKDIKESVKLWRQYVKK
ncbi:hypothetical protein OAM22_00750 [Candidatus Pelagibacter sp.]|nr:hypothetical protein [Candidatus Pelagibacter sp.]